MKTKNLLLTRVKTDAFVELLESGLGVTDACRHECVSIVTYKRWFRFGRARVHGDKVTDGFDVFADFYLRVSKAQVTGRRNLLETIRMHSHTDWKAAAYLLERLERSDTRSAERNGEPPASVSARVLEQAREILRSDN